MDSANLAMQSIKLMHHAKTQLLARLLNKVEFMKLFNHLSIHDQLLRQLRIKVKVNHLRAKDIAVESKKRAHRGDRTLDHLIKSQALYH